MTRDWEERREAIAPYVRRDGTSTRYHVIFPESGEIEVVPAAELRAERGDAWLNFPNGLTFLRALLVPVILALLVLDTRAADWWAFTIFVFAAATDTIDGWVARRWHGVTRWGQLADPIADKLLVIGTLAALAWLEALPWWAVTVIIIREVAVTLLRVRLVYGLDLVMPASGWGKVKTLSQLVAVAVFLVPGVAQAVRVALLYVAIVATVLSGFDYAFRAGRIARRANTEGATG